MDVIIISEKSYVIQYREFFVLADSPTRLKKNWMEAAMRQPLRHTVELDMFRILAKHKMNPWKS